MNRILSLLALVALVLVGTHAASAQAPRVIDIDPPTIDFDRIAPRIVPMAVGSWDSTYGTLTMTQREDGRIIGNYNTYGRLNGRLNGNKMTGTFYHPNNSGRCSDRRQGSTNWGKFEFTFSSDRRSFEGKWNWCGRDLTYSWDATKM